MKMNAGIWIGVIIGAAGIIIPIVSILRINAPYAIYIAGGILLIGVFVFSLLYKLIFGPMILRSRLEKTGISGIATIKEVHDTNVTINNNPQVKLIVEVKNTFGQIYTATIRTLVSRINPSQYQPGIVIPVKIDPKNENNVIIDFSGTQNNSGNKYTQAQISSLEKELLQLQKEGDIIRQTGVTARAIIKTTTWLGIYINGNDPYNEFELEVLPDNAQSFTYKARGVISEKSINKYQPGKEIFVKYDPNDLTKVALYRS